MLDLLKNPFIFLMGSSCIFTASGLINVDIYEHNNLFNLNNHYFKIFVSADTCNQLKLKNNGSFLYMNNGIETFSEIFNLYRKNKGCEFLIYNSDEENIVVPISYKIGTGNIWSQIFK